MTWRHVFVFALMVPGCSVSLLFPFGETSGDTRLSFSDDGSMTIGVPRPYNFYNTTYNDIYVNANGYLLLGDDSGFFTSRANITDYEAAIVGFHEDLFNVGGDTFFRQTQDASDLQLATEYFTELFPAQTGFQATSLIIVTFNRTATFATRPSVSPVQDVRFFQMVVVDSDMVSGALFLYEEIDNFRRPVAIGVHAGDDLNFGTLCVYRTNDTEFVDTTSQTGCSRPGLYGFITILGQPNDCVESMEPITDPNLCLPPTTEAPAVEAADQQTDDLIRVFVLVQYTSSLALFNI